VNLPAPPPDVIGKRALVHWNLHRNIYSVKILGMRDGKRHPMYYAAQLTLRDCSFRIDGRLRELFERRPTRRTVHAHVVGTIEALAAASIGGERVSCNPFRYRCFATSANQKAVAAERVVLHPDKRIEAIGITVDPHFDVRAHLEAAAPIPA